MPSPGEVLLVITDAGGGHRAAANALLLAAEQHEAAFRFRILRLQDAFAGFDFTRGLLGNSMEDTYNRMVRRGRTRFLVPLLRAFQLLIATLHRRLVRVLAEQLARERPAAVVSLMPNFNAVIRDALRAAHPEVPFLVLLTDYADFPPHFWLEPDVDRVIVGSPHALEQALELLPRERISRTSGMPLHPRHYAVTAARARVKVRRELKLADGEFVVMLLFGGKGVPEMEPLAAQLLAQEARFHVVAVCGDNPPLLAEMRALAARSSDRLHPLGFTDRVAELLGASDVLLTKPGPGSLAEALHHGVPAIVTCNEYTIPQERWNARMLRDQGLGLVVEHWSEMPFAASLLLRNPEWLRQLQSRIRGLPRNRAVYEALEIIQLEARLGRIDFSRILTTGGTGSTVSLRN